MEKSYKYFTGYLYNDNKVKPIHIMLSKVWSISDVFFDSRWWLIIKMQYYLGQSQCWYEKRIW